MCDVALPQLKLFQLLQEVSGGNLKSLVSPRPSMIVALFPL